MTDATPMTSDEPWWRKPQSTNLGTVFLGPEGTHDGGAEVSFTEHYEIIDINLPYQERFRTLRYTATLYSGYDKVAEVEIDDPHQLLDGARVLLTEGQRLLTSPPADDDCVDVVQAEAAGDLRGKPVADREQTPDP